MARPHLSIPSDVLLSILLPHRLIESKVVGRGKRARARRGTWEEGRGEGQEGLGIKRYKPWEEGTGEGQEGLGIKRYKPLCIKK